MIKLKKNSKSNQLSKNRQQKKFNQMQMHKPWLRVKLNKQLGSLLKNKHKLKPKLRLKQQLKLKLKHRLKQNHSQKRRPLQQTLNQLIKPPLSLQLLMSSSQMLTK